MGICISFQVLALGEGKTQLGLSMFVSLAFRRKIKCAGQDKRHIFLFQAILEIL